MADLGGSTYSLRIKAVLDTSDINAQLNRVGRSVQNGRGRGGAGAGAATGNIDGQIAAINAGQTLSLTDKVKTLASDLKGTVRLSKEAQEILSKIQNPETRDKILNRVVENRLKGGGSQLILPAAQRQFNETVKGLEKGLAGFMSVQKRSADAIRQETQARMANTRVFSKATLAMSAFFTIMQAADRFAANWKKGREPIQKDLFNSGKFAQLREEIATTNLQAAAYSLAIKAIGSAGAGALLGGPAGAAAGAVMGGMAGLNDLVNSYFDTQEKMDEFNDLLRETIQSSSSSYEFEKSTRELEASVRKNMGGDLGFGILSVREKIADLERRVYEKQGEQYGYGKTIEPHGIYGEGEEYVAAAQNYFAAGNAIEEMREKINQYNIVLGKLEKEEVKHKADLLNREEKAVDKFIDVMTERSLDFKALTSLGERGLHATANLQTAQSIYSQCSKIVDILTKIEQKEGGIVWR